MMDEPSAADRAYAAIRDGILRGAHPADTMLAEASLAADLEMSRTPIRAALTRLQDDGWVTIFPKRGVLVRGMSDKDIEDLADARLMLESSAVRRLSDIARGRLAATLTASIEQQRAALSQGDIAAFVELTIVFHNGFVEAARNSVILELSERLADRQRFLLFSQGDALLSRWGDIIAEHERLVALLDDPDAFEAQLRDHVNDTHGLEIRRDRD